MPLIGRTDTFGGIWADACERCGLIPLRGVADTWEGVRSDTLDEERADTFGGGGRMPLGEGG